MKALAKLFHLLPVELSFFFEDQGHHTFAPLNRRQGLFCRSPLAAINFFSTSTPETLFDGEMPRFVLRDQSDKHVGSFRFFWSSTEFSLQFEKALNICFVLLGRKK
ncbi:MAG TPA: hypothetical protein VK728_16455 [Candidatus Sulfotelmatobacter sp.]|nr:hypothetical protein [Candidatus Sulfotelmatobacter sp.]